MSESTERIYALLVDANPVPDVDTLPTESAHRPHLYVIDDRSDEMQTQTPSRPKQVPREEERRRRTWNPVVAAAVVAVVVLGLVTGLLLSRDGSQPVAAVSPEEVVAQVIAASNAQDAEALAALYDPDIHHIYDASRVGASGANTDKIGRESVLVVLGVVWDTYSPNVIAYEVSSVDGNIVTTTENVVWSGGASEHSVTYEVSDDGLILSQRHTVLR